jgi:protein-tyrosine phosphatase
MNKLAKLIDCHNHVLPIDDGAQNDQECLKMLYDAVESNISTVFVTPHMIPGGKYDPSIEDIQVAFQHVQTLIKQNNLPIHLKLGSEFQINADSLGVIDRKAYLCYEDTNYLLIEFVRQNMHFGTIHDALAELSNQGVKIIIAHPERYFDDVNEAFDMAYRWIKQGFYLQVNRTSLIKNQNPLQRKIAFKLINANLVHIIASDAHRTTGVRRLILTDSYQIIHHYFGKECADLLHLTNVERMMNNQNLISMRHVARGYKSVLRFFIQHF